jgi:hypothetical protein
MMRERRKFNYVVLALLAIVSAWGVLVSLGVI